jgi:hypothetical protein
VRKLTTHYLLSIAIRLNSNDSQFLEGIAITFPYDLAVRILLIGFYFSQMGQSTTLYFNWRKHILWLVEHWPASEVFERGESYLFERADRESYFKARELWLSHIGSNPESVPILSNAARYLAVSDCDVSEALFRKCQTLDPGNPLWVKMIAHVLDLQTRAPEFKKANGQALRTVLMKLEECLKLAHSCESRLAILPLIAKAALEGKELQRCDAYASELLDLGNASEVDILRKCYVQHALILLGRAALKEGTIDVAKKRLKEAGNLDGPKTLNAFQPFMSLAKELLEEGEKDTVIEYLRSCDDHWIDENHTFCQWIHKIENGQVPEFGAKLLY